MDRYRVRPGTAFTLSQRDSGDISGFDGDKDAGEDALKELNKELEALQELLYAEGKHKVLVVLQAMDAAGKDSTIRNVFDRVNPQGVKVASFKKPSTKELAHDYLWRIHHHVPGKGQLTLFNRSHYEDVLVVRVHEYVPESLWRKRYDHIRNFEQMLADEGTIILKFFLYISKDEQKERLQARLDDPTKHWKFAVGDLDERAKWDSYMAAFEEAIAETSTEDAPWYVIPADRKWYRNLAVAQIVVDKLKSLNMKPPPNEDDLSKVVIE